MPLPPRRGPGPATAAPLTRAPLSIFGPSWRDPAAGPIGLPVVKHGSDTGQTRVRQRSALGKPGSNGDPLVKHRWSNTAGQTPLVKHRWSKPMVKHRWSRAVVKARSTVVK